RRVLASVRDKCAVFGYVVTKVTSAGPFAPLFLDDWETTTVHQANDSLEVIVLENGYRQPLRDISLYGLLEQCIRRLDLATAPKRPAVDTTSPVPAQRRRLEDDFPAATGSSALGPRANSLTHAPQSSDANPTPPPSSPPSSGDSAPLADSSMAADSTAAPAMATSSPVQPAIQCTAAPATATPTSAQSRTLSDSLRPVAHSTPLASTTAAAAAASAPLPTAFPAIPSADAASSTILSDNTASVFQHLPAQTLESTLPLEPDGEPAAEPEPIEDAAREPEPEQEPPREEAPHEEEAPEPGPEEAEEDDLEQSLAADEGRLNRQRRRMHSRILRLRRSRLRKTSRRRRRRRSAVDAALRHLPLRRIQQHRKWMAMSVARMDVQTAWMRMHLLVKLACTRGIDEEEEAESSSDNEAVDSDSAEGSEAGGDDDVAVEESVLAATEEASLHDDSDDSDSEESVDSEGSEASEDSFSEHTDDEEMELEKNKILKKKGDKHGYDPVRKTDRKKQPAGFREDRPLMPHQLQFGWMRRHELNAKHCGGILADEPGAGKTISMAAYLVYMKPHNCRLPTHIDGKRRANALIVVPLSVLLQWEAQLAREFLLPGALKVVLFYGPKRFGISTSALAEADAVITTPDTLRVDVKGFAKGKRSGEAPENKLGRFHWTRLIIDEAHRNRSEESNSTLALQAIFATYRWCISGTPVDGRASDADKLLSFLGCPSVPWKSLTLRRTKEDIVKAKKIFRTINVRMKGIERKAYDQMTQFLHSVIDLDQICLIFQKNDLSRGRAKERSREGGEQKENPATNRARDPRPRPDADDSDDEEYNWNYGYRDRSYREKIDELCKAHPDWNKDSARWESLTKAYPSYLKLSQCFGDRLIEMRIRQAAVHPAVAEKAVDKDMATQALSTFDADVQRQLLEDGTDVRSIFEPDSANAKIRALMKKLVRIVKSGDKCTVVTQYRSALKIVGLHLSKKGIAYDTMHGGTTAENRWDIIRRFNDPNSELKVVLLAIQSCGVGVDLPGGNHMFLLEPQESGAGEEQAFDRQHRIGQTKNCYCYR
ncbi:transcription termination factor 2-like protein, partial [Aphelenchoides avenae]